MLGTLLVPDIVLSECLYVSSRPDAKAIQQAVDAGLLEIRAAQFSPADDWPSALGVGEQAAIHLAQELGCQILMDDKLVRRTAASMGLHVIGTARVFIKAKRLARIEAIAPLLHTLQASGYHLGTCTK